MNKLLISVFVFFCAFSFASDDFDYFMGKGTDLWTHVQAEIDQAALQKYKSLYLKNKEFQNALGPELKIPRVIHFIWLGPKGYPAESVENIRSWIAQNPGWKVKFWTDRPRSLPCQGMELHFVQDFKFDHLGKYYERAQDWGQKSDILRYEILFREGGVYVDHDANCLKPFEKLHHAYDLYTCLELPHEAHCGRAITSGIGIVGSRTGHPVLRRTMEVLVERWDSVIHASAMENSIAAFQDTISKTYMPFTIALQDEAGKQGNVDMVFPSAYFYAKGELPSIYSKHFYAGAWREKSTENAFSAKINKQLSLLKKDLTRSSLISFAALLFSLIISFSVFRSFLKVTKV